MGFGSVLGAGGQLGLGLETELGAAIKDLFCKRGSQFSIHEITMPPIFTNGGIGTHWLLPNSLSFSNPDIQSSREILSASDVKKLVLALHSENQPAYDNSAAQKVADWARDGKNSKHDANWQALLHALVSDQKMPDPSCSTVIEKH